MLTITLVQNGVSATAEIPSEFAPAFRSAIAERREEVGGRASGAHKYEKEDALTRAIAALGTFAAALNAVVPQEDQHYA